MNNSSTVYIVLALGVLATLVLTVGAFSTIPGALGMSVVVLAALGYLAIKTATVFRQLGDLQRLRDAYDQMDQQTKLVIRTDLELHRAQEELDRRLASLMSLHQLNRQLEVTLQPDEVYGKLDASIISNFGCAKGLAGISLTGSTLEWRSQIGIDPVSAEAMRAHLVETGLLQQLLTNPAPRILQRASAVDQAHKRLLDFFEVPTAVIAGIMPHTGPAGCLLLGRTGSLTNPKAEEELVSLLTNQLAAAVENSALFEKAWLAQQELEHKVQESTAELAEANAKLIQMNKAKSDFVSAVSHELRTPLAAIKGYAALLASGQFGALADPQRERIVKIEKHSDLLTQFVTNLLDIARIESGHMSMERRAIGVEEFYTSIQDVVTPQIQAKHLKFSLDVDGVTQLVGDSQQLQRVFVNLLSNAIKYTPERGEVRVQLTRQGNAILAAVKDTGCGIGPEDQSKLFQEFYRTDDPINRDMRGTGLGLALVKRIVEAHQGRIWVESQRGKGSTFSVSLPMG